MSYEQYKGWKIIRGNTKLCPCKDEMYLILSGAVIVSGQSGGFVRAMGYSKIFVENQTNGFCEGTQNAYILPQGQVGGHVQVFGDAELRSEYQRGGYCRAYNGKLQVAQYKGGVSELYIGNSIKQVTS